MGPWISAPRCSTKVALIDVAPAGDRLPESRRCGMCPLYQVVPVVRWRRLSRPLPATAPMPNYTWKPDSKESCRRKTGIPSELPSPPWFGIPSVFRCRFGWEFGLRMWRFFMLGLTDFASLIPAALVLPLAGVLTDRWNRHRILLATQSRAMVQAFVLDGPDAHGGRQRLAGHRVRAPCWGWWTPSTRPPGRALSSRWSSGTTTLPTPFRWPPDHTTPARNAKRQLDLMETMSDTSRQDAGWLADRGINGFLPAGTCFGRLPAAFDVPWSDAQAETLPLATAFSQSLWT